MLSVASWPVFLSERARGCSRTPRARQIPVIPEQEARKTRVGVSAAIRSRGWAPLLPKSSAPPAPGTSPPPLLPPPDPAEHHLRGQHHAAPAGLLQPDRERRERGPPRRQVWRAGDAGQPRRGASGVGGPSGEPQASAFGVELHLLPIFFFYPLRVSRPRARGAAGVLVSFPWISGPS